MVIKPGVFTLAFLVLLFGVYGLRYAGIIDDSIAVPGLLFCLLGAAGSTIWTVVASRRQQHQQETGHRARAD